MGFCAVGFCFIFRDAPTAPLNFDRGSLPAKGGRWHCPGLAGGVFVPGLRDVCKVCYWHCPLRASAGATDSLPGKATGGSDWQCVQLGFAGWLEGLYGTGGGRRPAQTRAVGERGHGLAKRTQRAAGAHGHRNSRDGKPEGKAQGMTDSERSADPKGGTAYGIPIIINLSMP